MNRTRAVACIGEEALLDEVLKAAAAAGCEVERVADPPALRARWSSAPFVVLDEQAARACGTTNLTRRRGVVVVSDDPAPPSAFEAALQLGAERVLCLPAGDSWLAEALADATEGQAGRAGGVLAVAGGRGGAGASVFAAAIGLTALRLGRDTLLVDCDPLGGGLDLVLGVESEEGLRWPELAVRTGRVAASALRSALPGRTRGDNTLTVLSGARQGEGPAPDAVVGVIEAVLRAGQTVVCDLPRHFDAAACAVLDRTDLALVVVPAELRACASAKRVADALADRGVPAMAVVRGPAPGKLRAQDIADAVGLDLLATMRPEQGLAVDLERGEFRPRRQGSLATAARAALLALGRVDTTTPAASAS